jgi:hypothetical protein
VLIKTPQRFPFLARAMLKDLVLEPRMDTNARERISDLCLFAARLDKDYVAVVRAVLWFQSKSSAL